MAIWKSAFAVSAARARRRLRQARAKVRSVTQRSGCTTKPVSNDYMTWMCLFPPQPSDDFNGSGRESREPPEMRPQSSAPSDAPWTWTTSKYVTVYYRPYPVPDPLRL